MMMMMNYFCEMVDDDDGELFLWNGSPTNDEWWIVFVEWLTDERRLALLPTGTIGQNMGQKNFLYWSLHIEQLAWLN